MIWCDLHVKSYIRLTKRDKIKKTYFPEGI